MRPERRQEISFRAYNFPNSSLHESMKSLLNYENVLLMYIIARQVKVFNAQCRHAMVQHGTSDVPSRIPMHGRMHPRTCPVILLLLLLLHGRQTQSQRP